MTFKCKENCGECCGPIMFPIELASKNIDKATKVIKNILPLKDEVFFETEDGKCPFLTTDSKCNIYENRPEVCRMYGVSPELPCPYINSNGNPRSPAKVKHTVRKINQDIKEKMRILSNKLNQLEGD